MPSLGAVLLVDDDPAVLRTYRTVLERADWTVDTAPTGKHAIERMKEKAFDAIVSDVSMPEMGGVEFLRAVRARDVEVPVVLMTGDPGLESAMGAVEHGAFRYLVKPVDPKTLQSVVLRASRLHKLARLKREAFEAGGREAMKLGERAALEVRFHWGVEMLWMAYQPIVSWRERRVFGYEALLRTDEPLMPNPGAMLDAAERLGKVHELGRVIRARVARDSTALPAGAAIFVNLHAADLGDDSLFAESSPLTRIAPRVVLEITERASLDGVKNVEARVAKLRAAGFRVAVDDLGAGYAGLTSFAQLEPEVAKLDMSLVRGIDAQPRKQSIVRSMKTLCDELGMLVVAEGVETHGERDTLVDLGCDLFQGYLFARPERGFASPKW